MQIILYIFKPKLLSLDGNFDMIICEFYEHFHTATAENLAENMYNIFLTS